MVSNEYASTGSQFPETCPASGFTCPGKAYDTVNAVPGSKPIAVDSGQATTSINVTSNTTQLSFSLTLEAEASDVDTEQIAEKLADLYGVATTAIELTVEAGSVVLTVAITTDDVVALALLTLAVNTTNADAISTTLGINASKPTTPGHHCVCCHLCRGDLVLSYRLLARQTANQPPPQRVCLTTPPLFHVPSQVLSHICSCSRDLQ